MPSVLTGRARGGKRAGQGGPASSGLLRGDGPPVCPTFLPGAAFHWADGHACGEVGQTGGPSPRSARHGGCNPFSIRPGGRVMTTLHHTPVRSTFDRTDRAHRWGAWPTAHTPRWLAFFGLLGAGVMYLRSMSA